MAKAAPPEKVGFFQRFRQIGMVFSFTAKRDKRFVPLVLAAAGIPLAAGIVLFALGWGWLWLPLGILVALLATLIVLNWRSSKAMAVEAEGIPGAAAQLIESMRGDWRVTPAIAATTQSDFVHLVIGRPGVILIAEGNPARLRGMLGQEKRRLAKVIGSTELHDFVIGNNEGQLPIDKLRMTLMRLPRSITGKEVNALDTRLKALSSRPQMPRGAIPKNMLPPNMPRGGRMR